MDNSSCSNYTPNASSICGETWESNGLSHAGTIAIYCCLGLLSLLIILTNSFVIILVIKREFLKTITNLCLACLAGSDLLSGLVAIPLIFMCNLLTSKGVEGARSVCITMDLASRFIAISTILHLLVVTGERYLMIVHPMKYTRIVRRRRVGVVLFGIWTFSLFAVLIQLAWIKIELPSSESEANAIRRIEVIYDLCIIFGIVLLPVVIMALAYGHIFLILRRQLKRISRLNSHLEMRTKRRQKHIERKAVGIFSTMILVFTFCWFSYFLASLKQDLNFETVWVPLWVDIVLLFMRFGTALLNPVLYTFFKEDFKRAIFKRRRDSMSSVTVATGV